VRYSVAERTHEIRVRPALGASQADVLALVVRQGIVMPAVGITIGLALSIGVTRIMAHLLFGVGAADLVTFAGVGLVLALVAAAACCFPARRAWTPFGRSAWSSGGAHHPSRRVRDDVSFEPRNVKIAPQARASHASGAGRRAPASECVRGSGDEVPRAPQARASGSKRATRAERGVGPPRASV
jgi:hypothetical protein